MSEKTTKQEWEDRYETIKNTVTTAQIEAEFEEMETEFRAKNAEFARKLAEIKDTTSPEYRKIKDEKTKLEREHNNRKLENKTTIENESQIRKNLPLIERTKQNRDVYQELLDELLENQKQNDAAIERRKKLSEESKKLDEKLQELKEDEAYCLTAINNPNAPEENKEKARQTLQETRAKIKQNQSDFSDKQLLLKKEQETPLIEIKKGDIQELESKIARCNKICELLLEGKTMGEVQGELAGKEEKTETRPEATTGTKTEGETRPEATNGARTEGETKPEATNGARTEGEGKTKIQSEESEVKPMDLDPKTKIPLYKIAIEIDKDGSKLAISRRQENKFTVEKTYEAEKKPLTDMKGLNEIIKSKQIGDKYIIREIKMAVSKGKLTPEEGKNKLEIYAKLLETKDKEEREKLEKDFGINIKYDLRGMRKSGLTREERKELEANAKQARDCGIAKVKAPLLTKAKWVAQDVGNSFKKGMQKLLPAKEKVQELPETTAQAKGETTRKPGELSAEETRKQQEAQQTVAARATETTIETPEATQESER